MLMKLNPNLPYGVDYSTIALALFLQEEGFGKEKGYSIHSFAHFLYRFYSDVGKAKKEHYHKMINEIWHYGPGDIYEYAKSVLKYVEDSIGLVAVGNTDFYMAECSKDLDQYTKLVQNVIQTLVVKYIGSEFKFYDSRIKEEEFQGKTIFSSNTRVFYRAMEIMNYCFISDETCLEELCAVALREKGEFDPCNYLVLNKKFAKLYQEKRLIIKKNGYPYLDQKRLYQHIEIGALKKLRGNLAGI